MTDLNECFNQAIRECSRYIAVRVKVGFNKEEVIINPFENFVEKQVYYNRVYNDRLQHMFSDEPILITGYAHGDSFSQLELDLDIISIQ